MFSIINIRLNTRQNISIVSNGTPDYFPIYLIHIQTYIVSSGSGFAPDNSQISIIHQYLVIYILQKSPTQRQKCDENQLSTLLLVPFGCHLPTVLHFPRPEDSCYYYSFIANKRGSTFINFWTIATPNPYYIYSGFQSLI